MQFQKGAENNHFFPKLRWFCDNTGWSWLDLIPPNFVYQCISVFPQLLCPNGWAWRFGCLPRISHIQVIDLQVAFGGKQHVLLHSRLSYPSPPQILILSFQSFCPRFFISFKDFSSFSLSLDSFSFKVFQIFFWSSLIIPQINNFMKLLISNHYKTKCSSDQQNRKGRKQGALGWTKQISIIIQYIGMENVMLAWISTFISLFHLVTKTLMISISCPPWPSPLTLGKKKKNCNMLLPQHFTKRDSKALQKIVLQ